jgi:hypothetical protein
VPELVPFRLTRQLQGLFLPHAPCDALHPLLAALLESMRQEAQVGGRARHLSSIVLQGQVIGVINRQRAPPTFPFGFVWPSR